MRQISVSLFTFFIVYLVVSSISTEDIKYETEVVFYHQQVFPKDYYWIVMQIEHQGRMQEAGDKGLRQLARDLNVLKEIVDECNNADMQHLNESSSSQINFRSPPDNKTIYPSQDQQLTLIINDAHHPHHNQKSTFPLIPNPDTQAFSTRLTTLQSHLNHFHLTLSSMDIINIHTNRNDYSILQQVYLGVPIVKRQQLMWLIDRIQQQFYNSGSVRILDIQKGNRNSYVIVEKGENQQEEKLFEKNLRELIDEGELNMTIRNQAEAYCEALGMRLTEIKSYRPLIYETSFSENQTLQEQQQQFHTKQPEQQIPYNQAIEIVSNSQLDDYENVFYEVKAICKGNERPKRIHVKQEKSNKSKMPNKKDGRSRISKKDKIQQQINKLNHIIRSQSNN